MRLRILLLISKPSDCWKKANARRRSKEARKVLGFIRGLRIMSMKPSCSGTPGGGSEGGEETQEDEE